MRRSFILAALPWCILTTASPTPARGQTPSLDDSLLVLLRRHEYDLEGAGRTFLLDEARRSDFFMLGELHGDNEIPALLRALWPVMWRDGYRHVAAEISPWAAHELQRGTPNDGPTVTGLWTKAEAASVLAFAGRGANVLWGCDMEEVQPEALVRRLTALNPGDGELAAMEQLTRGGYRRSAAPELLGLLVRSRSRHDEVLNDVSLRASLRATLEIEQSRASPDSRTLAQQERELLMKRQFLEHLRRRAVEDSGSKVLLRFGRNHLHRGYDARGVSTLGNFIAELAVAQNKRAFNVGAFGAGGRASLRGTSWDADERADETTFALLAREARYGATLFDLRPLRPVLHRIPPDKRSALHSNLIYWVDSYDALISFRTVTPLEPSESR
jgi:hypothetical protein